MRERENFSLARACRELTPTRQTKRNGKRNGARATRGSDGASIARIRFTFPRFIRRSSGLIAGDECSTDKWIVRIRFDDDFWQFKGG